MQALLLRLHRVVIFRLTAMEQVHLVMYMLEIGPMPITTMSPLMVYIQNSENEL
jgi:hypothetical protein